MRPGSIIALLTAAIVLMAAPETASAQAQAGTAPSADLKRYVGKFPYDKVGKTRILDEPALVMGLRRAVKDMGIVQLMLQGQGPSKPIAVAPDGKLKLWQCQAQNCGGRNWSMEIDPDSGAVLACFYDPSFIGRGKSRWFQPNGTNEDKIGGCPSS